MRVLRQRASGARDCASSLERERRQHLCIYAERKKPCTEECVITIPFVYDPGTAETNLGQKNEARLLLWNVGGAGWGDSEFSVLIGGHTFAKSQQIRT